MEIRRKIVEIFVYSEQFTIPIEKVEHYIDKIDKGNLSGYTTQESSEEENNWDGVIEISEEEARGRFFRFWIWYKEIYGDVVQHGGEISIGHFKIVISLKEEVLKGKRGKEYLKKLIYSFTYRTDEGVKVLNKITSEDELIKEVITILEDSKGFLLNQEQTEEKSTKFEVEIEEEEYEEINEEFEKRIQRCEVCWERGHKWEECPEMRMEITNEDNEVEKGKEESDDEKEDSDEEEKENTKLYDLEVEMEKLRRQWENEDSESEDEIFEELDINTEGFGLDENLS